MSDPKPAGPFALNPARIVILVLGILAIIFIVGSIMGGLSNYQLLRESTSSSSEPISSKAS